MAHSQTSLVLILCLKRLLLLDTCPSGCRHHGAPKGTNRLSSFSKERPSAPALASTARPLAAASSPPRDGSLPLIQIHVPSGTEDLGKVVVALDRWLEWQTFGGRLLTDPAEVVDKLRDDLSLDKL